MKKYLNLKTAVIALIFVGVILLFVAMYRMFWQFKDSEVKTYIDEEASKFGADKAKVAAILKDGVEYILSSHNLTQQVIKSASASNTPKELELVQAAAKQCRAFGYID